MGVVLEINGRISREAGCIFRDAPNGVVHPDGINGIIPSECVGEYGTPTGHPMPVTSCSPRRLDREVTPGKIARCIQTPLRNRLYM